MLFVALLAVAGLAACSDDEPKDAVKEIGMQISSETCIMYNLFDDERENPIECMLVMSEDNPGHGCVLGSTALKASLNLHYSYCSVTKGLNCCASA